MRRLATTAVLALTLAATACGSKSGATPTIPAAAPAATTTTAPPTATTTANTVAPTVPATAPAAGTTVATIAGGGVPSAVRGSATAATAIGVATTRATTAVAGGRATTTATARGTTTRAAGTPWGSPLPTLGVGQTYRDPQGRFSFTIPSNWVQAQAASAEVAFQSPAPRGTIPAAINVILEPLPGGSVTLDEYDQAGTINLRQQFPDYAQVSLERVTVDGRPAYKRVFTATVAGTRMQLQQIYLIDRDTAYLVTCGATQETFPSNVAVCDQISGTFKVGAR